MWNFIRTFYAIAGLYQTFSLCTWQRDNFQMWETSPKSENKFIDCHENFAHCLPLMRTFLHPGDLWRVKFCWMTLCKTTQVFNKDVSTLQPKEIESGTHTQKRRCQMQLSYSYHILTANWMQFEEHTSKLTVAGICVFVYTVNVIICGHGLNLPNNHFAWVAFSIRNCFNTSRPNGYFARIFFLRTYKTIKYFGDVALRVARGHGWSLRATIVFPYKKCREFD